MATASAPQGVGVVSAGSMQTSKLPHEANFTANSLAILAEKCTKPLVICCMICLAFVLLSPPAFAAAKAAATSPTTGLTALAANAISFILHLDKYLGDIVARYGTTTYAILFAIVFAETGLVITPFLPGDSLLFATGALAALGKLNVLALMAVYVTAATLGDAVNYASKSAYALNSFSVLFPAGQKQFALFICAVGNYFGSRALKSKFINKDYIDRTEQFYAEYGGKTVVLARFVPIVRTFAPFVAGVGSMPYSKFGVYNVLGAVLWTGICTGAGYAFGNVPSVHNNFSLVVLGIVVVSVLHVAFEILMAKKEKK
jgi:membrane-associated protein